MFKKLIFIVLLVLAGESHLLSQISFGTVADLVVCGETVSWELNIEEAGILTIEEMPYGFTFEGLSSSDCGATLISSTPITIDIPEACSIIYEVKANCESFIIGDPDQGGNPDTTFTSTFTFEGEEIILDVIASINEPILSIELVAEETNPMPFEPFKRIIRICQDGTDAYLIDDLEVCFDQSTSILLNSVSIQSSSGLIPLTIDANTCISIATSLFVHALDRQNAPTGFEDDKLEGPFSDTTNFAECMYLELDLEISACEEGDYEQTISSTWACNNQNCALPDSLALNSNPNPGEPNLELTFKEANDNACINENFRWKAINVKNTGSAPASNISLFLNIGPGGLMQSNSKNAFDAGQIIMVDTNNLQSTIATNNLSSTLFDVNGSQAECLTNFSNLGGLDLSTNFEAIIPITLEAGDSISILFPEYYCCESSCGAIDSWLQSSRSCEYTNICGSSSYLIPWQNINPYFDYTIATSSVLPNDLDDAQSSSLSLDVTDFRVGTYLPQHNIPFSFFMSVTLDCGLTYNGNAQFFLGDGSLASPDVLTYDANSKELYIEFGFPFAHDQVLFQEGSFALDVTGECDACGGGPKLLDIQVGLVLGDNCNNSCELLTQCYTHLVDLHCSNCEWEGISPNSYSIERTNFGLQDYNNDGIADNSSLASANNPDVKKNRATIGDTLKGQWTAIVNTSAAHPIWNYAYAQTVMSGLTASRYVEVFKAEIEVHDKSTGNVLTCNNVPFDQVGIDEANFDFSPISMCFNGCPDLCVFGYQEGDSIVLSAYYTIIDTDICAYQNSMDIQVATDMYAAEVSNPPENNPSPCSTCDPIIPPTFRWTCENYSGSWYMVNPFMISGTNGDHAAIGCNSLSASQSFYWSIGGVYGNNFPFEYRPLAITETVWFTVPPNWIVNEWSIINRVGAGDGSSQGGNKSRVDATINNAIPDGIDPSPNFGQAGSIAYRFDLEQYFNDGTFTVSDEGSELTLMVELTPTCELENLNGDYTQHLAEFKWLNNNSNCFYDPFIPSKDNINWIKPNVALQANKQTIPVECPTIEWPLSAINLSNGPAENAFLYISPNPAFTINEIRDSNNVVIPKSGSFYSLSVLGARDQLDLIIDATFSSCQKDSINVFLGWDCDALPTDISDACDLENIWLFADPGEASLKMSVIEPAGPLNIGLCDSVYFEFGFRNLGDAKAFNLNSSLYLPLENINIVPNSLQIEYPCGSGYVNWASTYPQGQSTILGNLFKFDFTNESTQNPNIAPIGQAFEDGLVFPTISETENCFNIKFEMVPNGECGFQSSGGTIRTIFKGDNPCGVFDDPAGEISTGIQNTTTIKILGSDPYEVALNASIDPVINACVEYPVIDFTLELLDDTLTGPNDSIMILLPLGLTHESNSLNLPLTENIQGGIKTLSFPIDPPIALNEVLNVQFVLSTLPELMDCEQEIISIRSSTAEELICASNDSGDPCFVNTFTAVEELFVQFDKPDFEIEIKSAQADCGSDSLNTELIFMLRNIFSEDIQADQKIKIDVYANPNNDCQNVSNDSITSFYINGPLPAGAEIEYIQNVLLPPSLCNIELRLIDCVCTDFISDCEKIEIFLPSIADTTVCSEEMFQVETCENPNFTYQWSALGSADILWLDDPSIHNPSISVPNINGVLEVYEFEVEVRLNPTCSLLDTLKVFVVPSFEILQVETLCQGDSLIMADTTFKTTGAYTIQLPTSQACDSVISLDLTVFDSYALEFTDSLCQGESYLVGDSIYTETGSYSDTLLTVDACDSIVNLNLTVFPFFNIDSSAFICEGDSIVVGSNVYTSTGSYSDLLQTSHNCDSLINLDLTVYPSYEFFLTENICVGDSIKIGDTSFVNTGLHELILKTFDSCDSIFHLDLTVNETYYIELEEEICEGSFFEIGDSTYTKTNYYLDTLSSSFGCDSIISLNLMVHEIFDTLLIEEICEGDSLHVGNTFYKSSGSYEDTLLTSFGCDSIIRLDLSVNGSFDTLINYSFCQGDSLLFGGEFLDSTGVYVDSLFNQNNCDSIISLDLIVFSSYQIELEKMICEGQSFAVGDSIYTESNFYTDTLSTFEGCDSIIALNLIVADVLIHDIDSIICEGEFISIGTSNYSTQGIYSDTLVSSALCDSIVNLNLQVELPVIDTLNVDLCGGDSILFGNEYFMEPGIYIDSFLSLASCDSIWVLNLNVSEHDFSSTSTYLCEGDSVIINGLAIFSDTLFIDSLIAENSCDSIHIDSFIFYPKLEIEDVLINLCLGDTFELMGIEVFEEGIFVDSLLNKNSCDSIITYVVNVVDVKRDSFYYEFCEGDSVFLNNFFYFQDTIMHDTILSQNACDSIASHILSLKAIYFNSDTTHICRGDSILFNDAWLKNEAFYADTLLRTNQCDSIISLQVYVLDDYLLEDSIYLCLGDSIFLAEQYFFADTVLVDSMSTSLGCDSLNIIHVLFYENTGVLVEEIELCLGDSIQFGDQVFYESGIYTDSLASIFACDSIIQYHFEFINNFKDTINMNACQGDSILIGLTYYFEETQWSDTLMSSLGCDSILYYDLGFNANLYTEDSLYLTNGDSVFLGGGYQSEAGVYLDSLQSIQGCDSIHTVSLFFQENIFNEIEYHLCEGEFLEIKNLLIEGDTIIMDTLVNTLGQDSIVSHLIVFHPSYPENNVYLEICEGDSVWYNDQYYFESRNFIDSLYTSFACDSFTVVEIVVNTSEKAIQNLQLCVGESFEFQGELITNSGLHLDTFTNQFGCDSIIGLDIIFLNTFNSTEELFFCEGEVFEFENILIYQDTVVFDTLLSINECDSIIEKSIFFSDAYESELLNYVICDSDSLLIDTFVMIEAGLYELILSTENNCDSILLINLETRPTYQDTFYYQICSGEEILVGGQIYDQGGVFVDSLNANSNCDSVVVSFIEQTEFIQVYEELSICAPDSILIDGLYYTESTLFVDTIKNNESCDSILQLNLVVYEEHISSTEVFICEGESYSINGQAENVTGIYFDSLLNIYGCDSIVEINLSIIPLTEDSIFITICEGENYEFFGETLALDGTYQEVLGNSYGCDSTIVLSLEVILPVETFLSKEICFGESYVLGSEVLSQSGDYVLQEQSSSDCDSIVYLDLIVLEDLSYSFENQICEGDVYQMGALSLTQTGIYSDMYTSYKGCDSLVTVHLTVGESIYSSALYYLCDDESIEVNGQEYNSPQIFYDTLISTYGCDSIVQHQLKEASSYKLNIEKMLCEGDSMSIGDEIYFETGVYEKILKSQLGCDSIIVLELEFTQDASLAFVDTLICAGETLQLSAHSSGPISWYPTDGLSCSNCERPSLTAINDITYTAELYNCEGELEEMKIDIQVEKVPSLDYEPEIEAIKGTSVLLEAFPDDFNSKVNWFSLEGDTLCLDCISYEVEALESTMYLVEVVDQHGCNKLEYLSLKVLDQCENASLKIPNFFSPNEDGFNDDFRIRAQNILKLGALKIFNRWGQLVFETDNPSNERWKGKFKGEALSKGVYVYFLEVHCLNDEIKIYSGNVTILN